MNFIFPLIAILIAIIFTGLISIFFKIKLNDNINLPIDGFRGYLAFFVFLHHSSLWYHYLRTNIWGNDKSNLFNHFGQTSVAFFFMITSFLFFTKLIKNKKKGIDWNLFYISRIMRLFPLYLFLLVVLFLTILFLSNFKLNEPVFKIIREIIQWSSFTIAGSPNINGIKNTSIMVAGVIWSLPYEWLFYCFLPIIGWLVFKIRLAKKRALLLSIIIISIIILIHPTILNCSFFIGGILASYISQNEKICAILKTNFISFLLIILFGLLIYFFSNINSLIAIFIIYILFICIASGNTLFGLLISKYSRILGQMAYGIYLTHGLILFITFNFIMRKDEIILYSPLQYWSIIYLLIIPLISICFLLHVYIELPGIKLTHRTYVFVISLYNKILIP